MPVKLKDIGEREIIDRLRKTYKFTAPQDDCSLIDNGRNYLMITTDSINFKTHVPSGAPPDLAGSYFASLNLSDIAAMAGIPIEFMTAYSLSPETDYSLLEKFESGMVRTLREYKCDFAGGDLKEGFDLNMTGIAVGRQKKLLTRKRSDLAPNQIIGVTNSLGKAAAGYVFYSHKIRKASSIRMMLDIKPRIREAQIISEHGGKFMMDLSDGLASSMQQMKRDYGLGFRVVQDELPAHHDVKRAIEISGVPELDLTMGFGGDYELFFSVENSNYPDFRDAMESEKISVSFIGDAWKGDNLIYNGSEWNKLDINGYEHFRKNRLLQ